MEFAKYYTAKSAHSHTRAVVVRADNIRDARKLANQALGGRYEDCDYIAFPHLTRVQVQDIQRQGWCDCYDGMVI